MIHPGAGVDTVRPVVTMGGKVLRRRAREKWKISAVFSVLFCFVLFCVLVVCMIEYDEGSAARNHLAWRDIYIYVCVKSASMVGFQRCLSYESHEAQRSAAQLEKRSEMEQDSRV
jgi:hypothetical protein